MKLQKLCYYSYGYHLAWEDRRLFDEHFEAWANGPVSPQLYAKHRGRFELSSEDVPCNPDALDHGERESINLVLQGLETFTAHELSAMTHREPPWKEARRRSGAEPLERSNERLRDDEIAEFFIDLTTRDSEDE
ncbi:Panacea domain-containing protein [Glycomyces xiaoerkulensis]|uniref:Panacea domain-containing protein n=1 Tax=Glycomyces xiaoerkulensis TaxID=2038139 RepID=UPI0018E40F60|nr:type II toxin-antitoxin system antitoxin SocA domain-containing protein [Glycomyces xiaoerkulensis]